MNEILGCIDEILECINEKGCNLENYAISSMEKQTFNEVYESHTDHVIQKWENYPTVYQAFYHKFIGKSPTFLEIGVENGGSLQVAKKYFGNGDIYGVDINPNVCQMDLGENITTYCFDINSDEAFKRSFNDTKFDIILDDGSHINSDIITTFKNLYSLVKPGGVYLVEDMHTSYWPGYEGGYRKKDSAIEFFKDVIDLLNSYHFNYEYRGAKFLDNMSKDDSYVFEWTESISFYDSMVVIQKLEKARVEPYKIKTSGIKQPVARAF